jgi:hypothetical protein
MSVKIPVDFQSLVQGPRGVNGSDYPYSIKATDLMKNFVYSALDADESLIEESTGQGGYKSRRLKIPAVSSEGAHVLVVENGTLSWLVAPTSGTYVLGVSEGSLNWIATEEC